MSLTMDSKMVQLVITALLGVVAGGGTGTLVAGSELRQLERRVDGLETDVAVTKEKVTRIETRQIESREAQKEERDILIEIRQEILKERK